MTSVNESRRFRFALILVSAISTSAFFLAHYLFPLSWSTVLPSRAPSLSLSHWALPSAWLSEDGYLEYSASVAWGSRYTLLRRDAVGYSCDAEEVLADGQEVCRNTVTALKSLWSNTGAQQRVLANGEPGGEPAGTGSEGGLAEEFSRTYHHISAVAGKRILVIGDSLDRNWITDLVDLTAPSSYFRNHDLSSFVPADEASQLVSRSSKLGNDSSKAPHTLAERAIPFKFECGTAVIPIASYPSLSSNSSIIGESFIPPFTRDLPQADHQLRIDLVFSFGILNDGARPTLPVDTSDRVEALRQVIGGGMEDRDRGSYDAITINFGLWDLVGFQRRAYLDTSGDTDPGLTIEWLAEYSQTCERFIESLREIYGPHTHIYFRLVHVAWPGNAGTWLLGLPAELHALALAEAVPPFKPLRVAQLRSAQSNVAKRMGLKTLNSARLFEGYGTEITSDGTHPGQQANQVYTELLLRHLMAQ